MVRGAKIVSNFYLKSKVGRQVLTKFLPLWWKNEKIREKYEENGIHVPRFLFITINSQCNLHCTGCYARASNACGDICGAQSSQEMTCEQWDRIFTEAEQLGISTILVLGGETFLRMEILEVAAKHQSIIFGVFTNGTLVDKNRLNFLNEHRNIIPLISIEGNEEDTDKRRGKGVAQKINLAMSLFKKYSILFGASITATTKNLELTTNPSFIKNLQGKGCKIIYYVEYIPMEEGTDFLVLNNEKVQELGMAIHSLSAQFPDLIVCSAQADEERLGGCQGAGRNFFHISASGGAEPCPFSPYSAMSLKDHTLLEALQSNFFKEIRELSDRNMGRNEDGCILHVHRKEVEKLSEEQ